MAVHIIIDGYNLIRQSRKLRSIELQDIQLGRQALIDMLAAYKKVKPHKITVVFDGMGAPSFSRGKDRHKGIEIKFSRNGDSADTVIKRMSAREKQNALVVSSDRDILSFVEAQGCTVIESSEFEAKLASVALMETSGVFETDTGNRDGWFPTTKKKGPNKRLPKRERRRLAKIRKL